MSKKVLVTGATGFIAQQLILDLRAARDAGVPRTVMTSSCAAIAYGYPQLPAVLTEENWPNPDYTADCPPYPASKTIAGRAAWDFVQQEAPRH